MPRSKHRGAPGDVSTFAKSFVVSRLAGFEQDIEICLSPGNLDARGRLTHAYFPALAACAGTIEYLTAVHRGNIQGIGWKQVVTWSNTFLPQPDCGEDTVRVFFEAFRHAVAHRGVASGVWCDLKPGPGLGRRITWRVLADARRPSITVIPENGALESDPPWLCQYTHRVRIHLKSLAADISAAGRRYADEVGQIADLRAKFVQCMQQLYPK